MKNIHSFEVQDMTDTGKKDLRGLMRKLIPLWLVLIAAAAVGVVAALPVKKDKLQSKPRPPVNVTVERIAVIPSKPDTFDLDGNVEPNKVVKVAAEVSGRIERYGRHSDRVLKEGDFVEANQPLMYLNKDLLKAAFDQARAKHEYDLTDFKRVQEAMKKNVATERDLAEAETNMAMSKAALAEIKAQLDRTTILSPVSGVVNRLPMKVGEYVQPGDCCAEIVDNDTVKVVVNVPELDIQFFRIGQEQKIFYGSGNKNKFIGEISYISEVADKDTRTTRVELSVPNREDARNGRRKLYSGQIVTVRLKRKDRKNVIMVPLDAIIPLEKGYMVYVVQNGKAEPKNNVEIDIRFIKGKRILVTSGLAAGDRLILFPGNRQCGPGQAVRVISEEPEQPTSGPTTKHKKQEK